MLAQITPTLDFPAPTPAVLTAEFCLVDCIECMRACERCAEACLDGLPAHIMEAYRATLLEIADVAMWTAGALARRDPGAVEWCDLCADWCEAWIREGDAWETEVFQQSVDACRRCAESCREVALTA